MRLLNEFFSRLGRRAIWETAGYVFPRVSRAGRKFALAMASAGIASALLAPVGVVVLGVLAAKVKDLVDGKATGVHEPHLWILLAVACAFLVVVCTSITRYAKFRLGDELSWRVQREILEHAGRLDLSTLEDKHTQDVLERANKEPGKKVLNFAAGLLKVISSAVQVFGLAGVVLWIEPFWSVVLLAIGLPFVASTCYLSLVRFHILRNKSTSRRWTRYYAKRLTHRQDVPSTRVLGLAPLFLDRHRNTMRDILSANQRLYKLQMTANLVSTSASLIALTVVVILVARKAMSGALSDAEFATFLFAAWRLRGSMATLASSLSLVWDAQLSIANTREFLDLEPAMDSRGTLKPAALRGQIELRNVSFGYPRSSRPVLRDVSLTIEAGQTVAIVGANGAGKTTLAKLITRLYQVSEGEILIDGTPIGDFDSASLHQRMAFVFQQPARYEATAFENIAFGDWRRLLDRPDEVRRVTKLARIDDMIEGLPDGYDTLLGRMFGDNDLSGGQWQKLAIARSLAGDPAIVILDEPAANLDVNSEYKLYQGIHELIRGRTTVFISHRFSTVRMADRIFVLDEGRLVEQGTHDELVARGGAYAAMCKIHEATLHVKENLALTDNLFPIDLPVSNTQLPMDG